MFAVESAIFIIWICLVIADGFLQVLSMCSRQLDICMRALQQEGTSQHVVIVGASFGGLAVQRELSGQRGVRVTLIDLKEYFEYTPGVLRCFVQPSYLSQLTCPLPSSGNALLTGTMCGATDEAVVLRDARGSERRVQFDYLVLAAGSTYSDPVKPTELEPTLAERSVTWVDAAARLESASSVIIVVVFPNPTTPFS